MMKVVNKIYSNPYGTNTETFHKIIDELKDLAVVKTYITFKDLYEKLQGYIISVKSIGEEPEQDHPLLKANKDLFDKYAWDSETFLEILDDPYIIPHRRYWIYSDAVYYVFTFPDPVRVPERCVEQSTDETIDVASLYPQEPIEVSFLERVTKFLKDYCGGTLEECKEAMEKQIAKEPFRRMRNKKIVFVCPTCNKTIKDDEDHCIWCGQSIKWKIKESD